MVGQRNQKLRTEVTGFNRGKGLGAVRGHGVGVATAPEVLVIRDGRTNNRKQ